MGDVTAKIGKKTAGMMNSSLFVALIVITTESKINKNTFPLGITPFFIFPKNTINELKVHTIFKNYL